MDEIANGPKKEWRSNRSKVSQPKIRPSKPGKKAPKRAHSPPSIRRAKRLTPTEGAPLAGLGHATLPAFVAPCLATLSDKAPDSGNWVHEIKFDGYRIQARLDRGKVKLLTRKGLDWTNKFPTVAAAIAKLPAKSALIDGEVVVEGADGLSSFSLLQQDLKASRHDRMAFYAFDLMHLDGTDLKQLPLVARKEALAKLLKRQPARGPLRLSESLDRCRAQHCFSTPAKWDWKALCRKSLTRHIVRGAVMTGSRPNARIVKSSWSPELYRRPPTRVLSELLCLASMSAANCTMQDAPEPVSRTKSRARFSASSRPWRLTKAPFEAIPAEERGARKPIWVEPRMVVEVDFHGWTHGDRVRQASFQGVREDKSAKDVVREKAIAAASRTGECKTQRTGQERRRQRCGRGPYASRPDLLGRCRRHQARPGRLLCAGMEMDAAASRRSPDRTCCAVRKARPASAFFKNMRAPESRPSTCISSPEKGDKIISIDDLDGLIALVQGGVLEIHTRGTTIDDRESADRLVFDLDPGPGTGWKDVMAAARDVRERLIRSQAQELPENIRRQGPSRRSSDQIDALGGGEGLRQSHCRSHGSG